MKNLRTMNGLKMQQKPIKTRVKAHNSELPEGCISEEEFFRIFREKLIAAYENS